MPDARGSLEEDDLQESLIWRAIRCDSAVAAQSALEAQVPLQVRMYGSREEGRAWEVLVLPEV